MVNQMANQTVSQMTTKRTSFMIHRINVKHPITSKRDFQSTLEPSKERKSIGVLHVARTADGVQLIIQALTPGIVISHPVINGSFIIPTVMQD